MHEREQQKSLWTTREVAEHYRVGRVTVLGWVRRHGCPVVRLPGEFRFEPDAVELWLQERPN